MNVVVDLVAPLPAYSSVQAEDTQSFRVVFIDQLVNLLPLQ